MITNAPFFLQRRGANLYSNASGGAGNIVIVASGANVSGLLIRTLLIKGSGTGRSWLRSGSDLLFEGDNLATYVYAGAGFLIPAGVSMNWEVQGAGSQLFMSWDTV
jgi:hypothetical protein